MRICAIASASSRNPRDKSSVYTKRLPGLAKLVDKPSFKAFSLSLFLSSVCTGTTKVLQARVCRIIRVYETNFDDAKYLQELFQCSLVKLFDFLLNERDGFRFGFLLARDYKKIFAASDESSIWRLCFRFYDPLFHELQIFR